MNMFKRNNSKNSAVSQAGLAELALKNIHDGVIITDKSGVIQFINPAAVTMTECGSADALSLASQTSAYLFVYLYFWRTV